MLIIIYYQFQLRRSNIVTGVATSVSVTSTHMNTITQIARRKLIKPKKASLARPYSTSTKKPYLVVGLGNPGSEYQHTRHNIGFLAIEHIAQEHNIKLSRNKFNSLYGGTSSNNRKCY